MSIQEAVLILHEHEVVEAYWLADFERLVRQQTPLQHAVENKVQAAYLQIGSHRSAEALVLFEAPVKHSVIDARWYMPLRRLADSAGRGPNMGAGRIRLACRSQCSISWHADSLWEPVTSDFMAIRKALRGNTLRDQAPLTERDLWPQERVSAVERVSAGAGSLLAKKHSDPEVEDLKRTLRNEMEAYRRQLQQLQQEIERQKSLNEKLGRQAGASGETELEELRQVHRNEMAAHAAEIETLTRVLEQERQEAERLRQALNESRPQSQSALSNEEALRLKEEVATLRQYLDSAEEQSAERFVGRLDGLEAVLVAFHPGVGHLTISPAHMLRYADNPLAYAAQKCFVSEDIYRRWLDHYDDPHCQQCKAEIPRIEHPREFDHDLNAYCKLHRQLHLAGS
ncbi:hypothetical protein [Thalassolituus pacificus]|uniref:Uncharacterized protein n=1 Tax=Thalassolituus pacificus TaxID=2975440 RepID=A0A9X3AK82_9GAMM|nr:hypothetical protein [Thalassolituus pacificus]MCT7361021.1 hypothetical protein [Thalassolituus pacificus]